MILLPFTRPRTGLQITTDKFCVADLHPGFGKRALRGYREHPLPANLIRLSPVEPNISNMEQLVNILQSSFPGSARPQSVALCLPDLCARTTVFEFSSFPRNKKDCEALIRWRFQKDLNVSISNSRLSYRVYHPKRGTTPTRASGLPIRILATAVREDIIESYEAACLQSGLIPVSIGLAGLAVFDFCRSAMEAALQARPQGSSMSREDTAFLYIADWGFSFFLFREGCPVYLRAKPFRQHLPSPLPPAISTTDSKDIAPSPTENLLADNQPSSLLNTDSSGNPQQPHTHQVLAATVVNEVLATLQFYFETMAPTELPKHALPLFLAGSPDPDTVFPLIEESLQREFPEGGPGQPWITPIPLLPENPALPKKGVAALTQWTSGALSTFATATMN